jgi:hypothetical protein
MFLKIEVRPASAKVSFGGFPLKKGWAPPNPPSLKGKAAPSWRNAAIMVCI